MSKFWEKPIIASNEELGSKHRHVSWLELFHDLAFVMTIAVIGHEFAKHTDLMGFITFLAFFVPVWWAWLNDAYYNNRFGTEDHGHQVLTIVQMFGIIGLGIFAHQGLVDGYVGFAVSFAFVRAIVGILLYRVAKHNPQTRVINNFTVKTIKFVVLLWLLSIFVDPTIRYVLMVIAISTDVLAPMLRGAQQREIAVNSDHLTHRFGFFVIIILGEVLASIVRSINTIGPSVRQMTLAILAIALAFCVWWIYFENDYGPQIIKKFFTASGKYVRSTIFAGYLWNYAHLPLSMGIMTAAVGIEKMIIHGPNGNIVSQRSILLGFGMIVALISIGLMHAAATKCITMLSNLERVKVLLPFISSVLIFILIKTSYTAAPIMFLVGLVAICAVQIVLQEYIEHKLSNRNIKIHD